MDYRIIGNVGFAEDNNFDFKIKSEIDNRVISEIIKLEPLFQIPKQYENLCGFEMKLFFDEDNGPYRELILSYDLSKEDYLDVHFWTWINNMENYRFQQNVIKEYCERIYKGENCILKLSKTGNCNFYIEYGKLYEISVNEGLTNSQMYTRDYSYESTIKDLNFNEKFINCLKIPQTEYSRKDFANLIRDSFTYYRNIRASTEGNDFFKIGKEFKLK